MRILVAGASGVIGRPLVETLVSAGHHVTGTARGTNGLAAIQALGAEAVAMDGLDSRNVTQVVAATRPDVVVNQMTSLATPADSYAAWLATTNRLRSEATATIVAASLAAGARRVVSQSASFMTSPVGAGPTDETSPIYVDAPEPLRSHVLANIEGEQRVTGTPGIEGLVLRYGFLYGKGTAMGPGGEWVESIRRGTLPIVGSGQGRYPWIHVDDAVSATLRAIEAGAPGTYNIVDDEPAAQAKWLPHAARLLDAPRPPSLAEDDAARTVGVQAVYYGTQLRAASNTAAKAELGMTLANPSWRDGFRSVLDVSPVA